MMIKTIPRHSLVIVVGPDDGHRNRFVLENFVAHEVLSVERISNELIGEVDYGRLAGIVFPEMRRLTDLKLSIGERVVVNAANLKKEDRMSFASIAIAKGVPVFYAMTSPEHAGAHARAMWKSGLRDIRRGDGIADVIDVDTPIRVVPTSNPTTDEIKQKWRGITVIGDVHGMQQSLLSAISWARSFNHYIIFLGDVIDYGPQTLEVADTVYALVMRGEAEMLLGNHERKIARWIRRHQHGDGAFNLSEGNRVTTNALAELSTKAMHQWMGRFCGLVNHSQHVRTIGDFVLAHAAIHPAFWDGTASWKDIEASALFGEFETTSSTSDQIVRTYNWVEHVPFDKTAIVGHDIRRRQAPLVVPNGLGGCAIFMDTGCGKSGTLSSVDLRWVRPTAEIRLHNFNMY